MVNHPSCGRNNPQWGGLCHQWVDRWRSDSLGRWQLSESGWRRWWWWSNQGTWHPWSRNSGKAPASWACASSSPAPVAGSAGRCRFVAPFPPVAASKMLLNYTFWCPGGGVNWAFLVLLNKQRSRVEGEVNAVVVLSFMKMCTYLCLGWRFYPLMGNNEDKKDGKNVKLLVVWFWWRSLSGCVLGVLAASSLC